MRYRLLANAYVKRENFKEESICSEDDFFILAVEGEFSVERDDVRFTVRPGEGAFLQHGVLYQRKIIRPSTLHIFRFYADAPLFKNEHVTFRDHGRLDSTIRLLSQLNEVTFQEDFSYRIHLFSDIVTQYALENNLLAHQAKDSDPLIQNNLAYIRKRVSKLPSIERMAHKAGLSYVQYLRRFRAFTGMLPTDYIALIRLQKAKNLLAQTDLQIKEIAPICGFENEYYFCNFFKKHLSVSPSAYRKMVL